MVYKIEMSMKVTAYVKADNEEQLTEWMNNHSPREVESMGVADVEYEDNIICSVDGDEEIDITKGDKDA